MPITQLLLGLFFAALCLAVGFWLGWTTCADRFDQKAHERWMREHDDAVIIEQTTPPNLRAVPEPPKPRDRR